MEILGEVPGEDLSKIFISFSGVSFQGRGFYYWLRQGRGSLVNAAGTDVSHGMAYLVLLLFWASS